MSAAGPRLPSCPRSPSAPSSARLATSLQPSSSSRQRCSGGGEHVTLLGATGTGKTFTIAHVVEQVQRPTLVIAPNKSLAAQLANEFREVFPDNAVEYFVSYYDYYQPEAYIPSTDTYIEKDSSVNDEIERLRHSATAALLGRRDVLIVASVSCIYGLGSPEEYEGQILQALQGHRDSARVRDAAPRRHPVLSATTSAVRAARSGCRATRSRSSRRTTRPATGSSGGATRSRRSPSSTLSRASSSTTRSSTSPCSRLRTTSRARTA